MEGVDFKHIGVIGTGSMGSMMSLLFAENGLDVSMYDPSPKNLDTAMSNAKTAKLDSRISPYSDYKSFCESLGSDGPKLFLLSVPHGTVGDGIVDSLDPYLVRGDIIVDASNEWYANTQRRQGKMTARGVHYVGTGVSGGYQSARAGPSMSPSGDEVGLKQVMPLFEKIAANDPTQKNAPCVAMIGPGGSGHYVKMIHNGIEQGMMSALCEVWGVLHQNISMDYEGIAQTWEQWNRDGPLKNNFLISIGVDILRTKDESGKPMIDRIKDKVVQDVDESEGTGAWTCKEGMALHIPIPTIAAAHQFRLASAYEHQRKLANKALGGRIAPIGSCCRHVERAEISKLCHSALYSSFLAAFIQGLTLLAKADKVHKWGIDFVTVIRIWRAGCIIRSESIADLLQSVYEGADEEVRKFLLAHEKIAAEFKEHYSALKTFVKEATSADAVIPAASATLEYLKYSFVKDELPTEFMEVELDYFGGHNFELKGEAETGPATGPYHFGWHAAKSVPEEKKVSKI